jgi:hypothetical protein
VAAAFLGYCFTFVTFFAILLFFNKIDLGGFIPELIVTNIAHIMHTLLANHYLLLLFLIDIQATGVRKMVKMIGKTLKIVLNLFFAFFFLVLSYVLSFDAR